MIIVYICSHLGCLGQALGALLAWCWSSVKGFVVQFFNASSSVEFEALFDYVVGTAFAVFVLGVEDEYVEDEQ